MVSGCAEVVNAGSDDGGVDILWYFIIVLALLTWGLVKTRFLLGVPWWPGG